MLPRWMLERHHSFAELSTPTARDGPNLPPSTLAGATIARRQPHHAPRNITSLTSGMEGEGRPSGFTHRQQKRSHAQMDGEQASASPAWRHGSFPDNREAPPTYHGLPFGYDYDDRQSPANDIYDPPARYHFDRPPTPSFESALRSHARPPIERASSSAQHSHTAGLHLPRLGNMASSASRRFAGDGFDYRRPAGSASQHTTASVDLTGDDEDDVAIDLSQDDDIIDLTADDSGDGASHNGNNPREQQQQQDRGQQESHRGGRHPRRLPRGFDIIIDLDNGEEEWHPDPPAPQPSSPEIEFISSRTIPGQRHLQPVDENESDGEDVRFIRANALPEAEVRRRQRNEQLDNVMDLFGTLNGRFTHLRAQVDRFHEQVNRTANRFHEPVAPSRSASRGRAPHIRVGAFQAPNLDFDIIGFDIGPRVREAPPPPATYDAPPPAPEGFTRSPEEEGDALICPNCEEQLCVGSDEIKRQVWIVKGCGHVYCGECTANRSAKRSAKGKETRANTNPFKVCVVEDCDKNVSHKKSMIQVFL